MILIGQLWNRAGVNVRKITVVIHRPFIFSPEAQESFYAASSEYIIPIPPCNKVTAAVVTVYWLLPNGLVLQIWIKWRHVCELKILFCWITMYAHQLNKVEQDSRSINHF